MDEFADLRELADPFADLRSLQQVPGQEDEAGLFESLVPNLQKRGAQILGNTLQAASRFAPGVRLRAGVEPMREYGEQVAAAGAGFEAPRPYSLEGLKEDWAAGDYGKAAAGFGKWGLQEMVTSIPDMLMVAGPQIIPHMLQQTERLADETAKNSGKPRADTLDFVKQLPASVVIDLLDRVGLKGMMAAGRGAGVSEGLLNYLWEVGKSWGKATGKEALTEGAQEGVEYLSTTTGTAMPPTGGELLTRMALGTGLGAVGGGAVSAVTSPVNVSMGRAEARAAAADDFADLRVLENVREGEVMPRQPEVPPAENLLGWPASVSGFEAPPAAGGPQPTAGAQPAAAPTLTPEEFTDLSNRAKAAVTQELDRLGLKDFDVQTVDRLFTDTGDAVDAEYRNRIFKVALDTPLAELPSVMNHEVIHALKEMGAFTKEQWTILERAASQRSSMDPARLQQYMRAYVKQGMTRAQAFEIINEEAVGEMHREFHDGRLKPMGTLKKALQRIDQFFEATGNGLRGLGFTSSAGIMEAIQQGKFGVSANQQLTGPARFNIRQPLTFPLREQPQPTFYSAVVEAIRSVPDDKVYTGSEWLNLLTPKTGKVTAHPANVYGVKQEELEWSGLRSALMELQNERLSKKDVLETAVYSQPQVTFRGGWADDPNSGIEWGGWQDSMTGENSRWRTPELKRVGIRQASSDYIGELKGGFNVGHFSGIPNNIGWYRFGELVLSDGRRVLFIDEIQSDWQQRYRSSITRKMIEENRKLDPTVRKELPQPMVDLRPENYTAKPGETQGPGAFGVLQLLKSNRLVEQAMLLEWANENNYRAESPEFVARAWWRNWILERLLGNMSWSNTDIHSAKPEEIRTMVEQAMELADRLLPALQEDWNRTGWAKSARPKPSIPFNFEYKYLLGSSNIKDQQRILEVVKANLRRLVEAHIKSQYGKARGWDIIRKDGTVVEEGYLPQDTGGGLRPGGATQAVLSWLEQERYAMTNGRDTPPRAPAGPWVQKRDSFARLMLMDALHLASKEGMDAVVIIPGLEQAIRNSKPAEDPVVGIYDKNLQEDLRKAAKELGGAPEFLAEYRKGKNTFERDVNMEASTWGSSLRPMTHQQMRNVLTIAEQLIGQQSTGSAISPAQIVAAQNAITLIRDRVDQNSGSAYNYISDPRDGLSKMIIESDVDSALMPLGNQITEEQRPVVRRLVTSSIRKASNSVWDAGQQNRTVVGGLEAAARPLDAELVLRDMVDQIDAIAMNRAVQVRPDVASLGLTTETATILRNALMEVKQYLRRQTAVDAIAFTQDALVRFRTALASAMSRAHVYEVTYPGVADALTRKGEIVLLTVMSNAAANSRRMDQPRVAKGVQITPALANKIETDGARKFSIRRTANRQTTTNPQVAQQMYERLNRIYGTKLDAARLGKETARFNWFMKNILTLPQVERENWDVPGVRPFVDAARRWWGTKGQWVAEWDQWIAKVRNSGYGKAEQSKLWRFANEVTVLSDELGRRLTPAELANEARKVGGLDAGLMELWTSGRTMLQEALNTLEELARARVTSTWNDRILQQQDIVLRLEMEKARDKALKALEDDFQKMRNRDYWPLARFGEYTVNVVAKVPLRYMGKEFKPGQTVLFELYETEGEQASRKAALLKAHPRKLDIAAGKVDESLYSFMGLPPSVLRMLESELSSVAQDYLVGDQAIDAETMKMLQEQLNALRTVMLHFTPENAFKQRLLRRKGTRGFTDDGLRAMASLGQSFAGHIARAQHRGEMDDALKMLDMHRREMEFATDPALAGQGNKLTDLLNFFRRAQRDMMNPGNDLANLRALGFLWYLGAVPRAAFVQVWQPFATTYPWLASRYGDATAVAEMGKAYRDFIKLFKGKGGGLPIHLEEAVALGMKMGFLNQSLFTELAGVAEGSNLQRLLPGKFLKSQEAASVIRRAGYYSSLLFQKGEELNRLVTFKAVYMAELRKVLGMEANTEEQIATKMQQLAGSQQGKDAMSQAFLAARTAVESTQGEYARWARPELMRGKKSAIFLFKMYSQLMNYFAIRDPGKWRFLAIQASVAGALGLPFAEDLLDMLNAATQGAMCKTGDIRDCVREYVSELGANPELVMHGGSRYLGPWDLSANMSLGSVVPGVEPLTKAMMPGGDLRDQSLRLQTEALGALFAIPLNFAKALSTGQERDFEQAMPTIVRDVYRTIRRAREGGEVSRSGEMLVPVDWSDPGDVVTHLGEAIGFRSNELTAMRDMRWSQKEAAKYWGGRREAVVGQFYHLYKTEGTPDREALADVMKAVTDFNASVPYPEMAISGAQLKKGLRASIQRQKLGEAGVAPEKKYRRLYSEVAEGFAY